MRFRTSRKAWLLMLGILMMSVPFLTAAKNSNDDGRQRHRLEGTYHWAKKYYNDGRFRSAEKKLKRLLSFIDTNGKTPADLQNLRRKTLLLLAEVSEKIGKKKAAAEFLKQARALNIKAKKS